MFTETATNHRRVGLKFNTIITGPDMNVMLSSKEPYQGRSSLSTKHPFKKVVYLLRLSFKALSTCVLHVRRQSTALLCQFDAVF